MLLMLPRSSRHASLVMDRSSRSLSQQWALIGRCASGASPIRSLTRSSRSLAALRFLQYAPASRSLPRLPVSLALLSQSLLLLCVLSRSTAGPCRGTWGGRLWGTSDLAADSLTSSATSRRSSRPRSRLHRPTPQLGFSLSVFISSCRYVFLPFRILSLPYTYHLLTTYFPFLLLPLVFIHLILL